MPKIQAAAIPAQEIPKVRPRNSPIFLPMSVSWSSFWARRAFSTAYSRWGSSPGGGVQGPGRLGLFSFPFMGPPFPSRLGPSAADVPAVKRPVEGDALHSGVGLL